MILLHNRTRKLWQHYRLYDLYPNMLCIIFYYILYFLVAVFYVKKIMFLAPKNIFHPDPEVVFATVLLRFTTRKILK